MPETPSIILLHGNDEFAISAAIKKLCSGLGDPSIAEMNITRLDGRLGVDFEMLNTAINAAPFLAPRRVLVLANPVSAFPSPRTRKVSNEPLAQSAPDSSGLKPEEGDLNSDHRLLNRKKFLNMLEQAQPSTTLILAEYEELKPENWLLKWALKAATRSGIRVFNMPRSWELPRWIESEAKRLGGRIEATAAAHLAGMVGEDTRIASQELTKLLIYVNYERPVKLLDVEQVSIVSAQGSVFELVDALGQGEGQKAQHVLHQLLEEQEPFALWGMVIRQFRLLLQARELLDASVTLPEVQKNLGLHPFVATKVANQANRFSLSRLKSIYHRLLEIDEQAKTSQVTLDLALELLVVELAGS